jgi:hypothetical protein
MINTDASGQGSLVYGKTSDHVLGVRAVLMGGDILDTQAVPVALAETLGNTIDDWADLQHGLPALQGAA